MIKIIVALSVVNVLRWHSTTMNRMAVNKSLRGAGLLTKLGKQNDECVSYYRNYVDRISAVVCYQRPSVHDISGDDVRW